MPHASSRYLCVWWRCCLLGAAYGAAFAALRDAVLTSAGLPPATLTDFVRHALLPPAYGAAFGAAGGGVAGLVGLLMGTPGGWALAAVLGGVAPALAVLGHGGALPGGVEVDAATSGMIGYLLGGMIGYGLQSGRSPLPGVRQLAGAIHEARLPRPTPSLRRLSTEIAPAPPPQARGDEPSPATARRAARGDEPSPSSALSSVKAIWHGRLKRHSATRRHAIDRP